MRERSWEKTMEDASLLHTQEVRSSSPRAPTIVFRKLEAIGFIRTEPCPHGCPHRVQFVAVFSGLDPPKLCAPRGGPSPSIGPASRCYPTEGHAVWPAPPFDPAPCYGDSCLNCKTAISDFRKGQPKKNIWLCTPHSPLDDASYDFETRSWRCNWPDGSGRTQPCTMAA